MSEKLPPGTLCAVCEDLATGKHYSIASCNGCKTFFRRAFVNKREFVCQGNKDCPVNKGVRCACRYCRLQKCLFVGMDKNSIQNDRDRIGYTKRKRKHDEGDDMEIYHDGYTESPKENGTEDSPGASNEFKDIKLDLNEIDPIAERLTSLEASFTLLLSRCKDIKSYTTLEDALNAPSRFMQPITCEWTDPVVIAFTNDEHMPFWRQRLITLYIDWAKTFSTFRSLPYTDKVAMVTNHASSFMIMGEAFRTPEYVRSDVVKNRPDLTAIVNSSGSESSRVPSTACSNVSGNHTEDHFDELATNFAQSLDRGIIFGKQENGKSDSDHVTPIKLKKVKVEALETPPPDHELIRLPTEYGSLPATYSSWLPRDYGYPTPGHEGKSEIHNFFEAREFCEVKRPHGRPSSCNSSERSARASTLMVPSIRAPQVPSASLSGITPILAMMLDLVMKPFRELNVSTTEFSLLQAIMFFDPDTEGLDSASQRNVIAEQKKLLSVLFKHLQKSYNPSAANDRYASILLRVPTIRRAAAKKNESLQVLDMLQMHEMNSLVKETSLGVRPSNVHQLMGMGGIGAGVTFPPEPNHRFHV